MYLSRYVVETAETALQQRVNEFASSFHTYALYDFDKIRFVQTVCDTFGLEVEEESLNKLVLVDKTGRKVTLVYRDN